MDIALYILAYSLIGHIVTIWLIWRYRVMPNRIPGKRKPSIDEIANGLENIAISTGAYLWPLMLIKRVRSIFIKEAS